MKHIIVLRSCKDAELATFAFDKALTMKRHLYMIVKSGTVGESVGLYLLKRKTFGLFSKWVMIPQFFDSVDQAMTHVYRTDEQAFVKISVGNGTSTNKEIYKHICQSHEV